MGFLRFLSLHENRDAKFYMPVVVQNLETVDSVETQAPMLGPSRPIQSWLNYGQWFNVPYAITYFYNVYGNGEIASGKYATLIALFKEKMRLGLPLTVVSPGEQRRNFTHIDDIIDGLVLVGEYGYGDEFGIGCPDAYSIIEVAKLFDGPIEMLPERKGNRMTADVITSKTEVLGWSPQRKLADYIQDLRNRGWE
jgi:UDP-glucose 4-epimerase